MIDIRVSGLVKSFDLEKKILDGVSFQVDAGAVSYTHLTLPTKLEV